MAQKLSPGRIKQSKCVTKISPYRPDPKLAAKALCVHVEHESMPRKYSHVISTIPLGCVRMINLEECRISYTLQEALRSLQYSPCLKIGMKFKHRWWEEGERGHKGGVSRTDRFVKIDSLSLGNHTYIQCASRMSRMIVYPSYGIGGKEATIIVRSGSGFLHNRSSAHHILNTPQLLLLARCTPPCFSCPRTQHRCRKAPRQDCAGRSGQGP